MGDAFKNDRVAFEVGQDYARYGLPAPEDADSALMRGYEERRGAMGRQLTADRFVRKWLQVRFNAWKRNRFVSPDFTPRFLQSIDLSRCPVSDVEFTYATGADTDWSVDRIDNDGGYAPTNVMVIATRVNTAKGSLPISELMALGHKITRDELLQNEQFAAKFNALTEIEWRRLAWFAATSEKGLAYPVREVFHTHDKVKHLMDPWCCRIQRMLVQLTTFTVAERTEYWDFFRACSKTSGAVRALDSLRASLQEYAKSTKPGLRHPIEAFNDEARWHLFGEWWILLALNGRLRPMLQKIGKTLDSKIMVTARQLRDEKQGAAKGFG